MTNSILINYFCIILYIYSLSSNIAFAADTNGMSINDMLIKADNIRSSDSTSAQEILKKIALSSDQLSKTQQDQFNYLQAYQLTFQSKYAEAEELLHKIINSDAEEVVKFRAHYTLVNMYGINQNWHEGLEELAQVLLLSPNITNETHKNSGLIVTSLFYNLIGQFQLVLDITSKVDIGKMSARNSCALRQQRLRAKLRLALEKPTNTFHQADKNKQLNKEITAGINTCQIANESLTTNIIRTYRAELYFDSQEPDMVLSALKPYQEEILATNYPILITLNYNLIAQAYWLKKDRANTKKYVLLAKENSQLLAQTQQTETTYLLLYKLAEYAKDYSTALEYHKKYSLAKQTVLDESQAKHLAFQLAHYNNLANKKEIEQLNQQNKLLNTQHQLSKQEQENSLLLIMLLLSFLAVFALWSYRSWLTQQRLKLLTEFDSLTKVHSRGHFIERAKVALKYCEKNAQPLTCVLFDLDFFKKINDQYGHATGDKVLIKVAEVCQGVGRQYDVFGRLGGEEFSFILPGCNMIIAEDIANKCRNKIATIDHVSLGVKQTITASFGVSDAKLSGYELNNLLADADSAMYASKEHGRNCVNTYR